MVLPLVPLVLLIGGGLAGVGGTAAGTVGTVQIGKAQKQIRLHAARYERRRDNHLAKIDHTNGVLQ